MARQPKLDEEITERICALLRGGTFIETACASVGIPSRTFRIWLKKAAESSGDNRYTRFADAVRQAEATFESRATTEIAVAAKNDWRAGAFLLERRFARRWAQRVRVQIEGELDRMLDRAEALLQPEQFELLLEAVAADDGETPTGEEED